MRSWTTMEATLKAGCIGLMAASDGAGPCLGYALGGAQAPISSRRLGLPPTHVGAVGAVAARGDEFALTMRCFV
jgi:hypothetical protein